MGPLTQGQCAHDAWTLDPRTQRPWTHDHRPRAQAPRAHGPRTHGPRAQVPRANGTMDPTKPLGGIGVSLGCPSMGPGPRSPWARAHGTQQNPWEESVFPSEQLSILKCVPQKNTEFEMVPSQFPQDPYGSLSLGPGPRSPWAHGPMDPGPKGTRPITRSPRQKLRFLHVFL